MKNELINSIINCVQPYIQGINVQDMKLRLEIVLEPYEVAKAETALTVYEGDVNGLILKKFLAAKIAAGLSPRTISYYGTSIRDALAYMGKTYTDITADDIRLYLAYRIHKDGVSKSTANNERRNLSAFYSWLQKEEILLKNPMNKIDPIKETKRRRKAYTLLDLEKIRMGCRDARERALVEVLASTWCRVSEVANIKISDIKGNQCEVRGKGDKYRTVYLNARAMLAIEEYMKLRHDESPYLFPGATFRANEKGYKQLLKERGLKPWEWWWMSELVSMEPFSEIGVIERIVRNIGKRAGVENVHPHRFRRTGATMALRQGMPLLTVSKLLGHESVETTQIYLDISDEELAQAHEKYVV